ncbi:unnamed protein product [Somion occarium]|uniref:Asl1-like glycosyl hydrolase catalytic domain-containing protein n=1 Tax=Somion occarium TaxID=3059160 RepID=A0ABP1DSA0_9APHY
MKFSVTLVSLTLLLAGSVEAAHVKRGNNHRRHNGPSATFIAPTSQPTATAIPSPAPSSPSTGDGASKRGLAFNDVNLTKNFNSPKVTWAYNWASSHQGDLPGGVEFVPMLWSADGSKTNVWQDDATAAIASGSKYLLAFNEPDLGAQANMSPEVAAEAYKTYVNPFAGKAKLIAPAITNGGAPMGTDWLDRFLAACGTDCHIDGFAFHIYDSASNTDYFKTYISDFVSKYSKDGKECLLTEFGASGSSEEQQQFLNQILPVLDSLDGLTHYAYFGTLPGSLVNGDASRTAIGDTYVSV